jgi:hypothetical protein
MTTQDIRDRLMTMQPSTSAFDVRDEMLALNDLVAALLYEIAVLKQAVRGLEASAAAQPGSKPR